MYAATHFVNSKLFKHDLGYSLHSCLPQVKLTTGKNARQNLFVYLFAYLLVLTTSYFSVKLFEFYPFVKLFSCVLRNTTQRQDYIYVFYL